MSMSHSRAMAVCALILAGIFAGRARAETLPDALALAYQSNPTLQAQRAQLRALDETNVQARAGWRPTAGIEIASSHTNSQALSSFESRIITSESNAASANLSISQPLYTGGRTAAEVQASDFDILSARQTLRSTEATLLLNVITAYCDVIRDQKILKIREDDVALLQSEVDDADTRLAAGEVTKTDVAQTQTQLASSRTLLIQAQAQLQVSRAAYTAYVGQNPGDLLPPPLLTGLPMKADDAFDAAEKNSPIIRQAQLAERASHARVSQARAADHLTINLNGSIGYSGEAVPFYAHQYDRQIVGSVTITQPLASGGANQSAVRRALELNNSDRIGIEGARRGAMQSVSQAWNTLLASRSSIVSEDAHVRFARTYFTGTQAEFTVGQRSTLDIVVAEQSLRDAEITLVQVQADAYIAEAQVLAAIGGLELRALVEDAPTYDPSISYKRVKKLGATPWEGLISALDQAGTPAARADTPIAAPPLAPAGSRTRLPNAPIPAPVEPAVELPTVPFPETTSPSTPAREDGVRVDGADAPLRYGPPPLGSS